MVQPYLTGRIPGIVGVHFCYPLTYFMEDLNLNLFKKNYRDGVVT